MKELQENRKDVTEQHAVAPVKTEMKKIGELKLRKGSFVWKMNLVTQEITKAEFESVYDMGQKITINKIIREKDCVYCVAINAQNAFKKFCAIFNVPYDKNMKLKKTKINR